MRVDKHILLVAGLAGLGGCQSLTVERAQDLYDGDIDALLAPVTADENWRSSWVASDEADSEAVQLVDLIANNSQLRAAARRAEAAGAALDRQRALASPSLDLTGRASASVNDDGDGSEAARGGLNLDIPIDISGRLAAEIMGARSRAQAAQARYADQARVTSQLLGLALIDAWNAERRLTLLAEQVDANRTQLELIQLRFMQGQSSIVDVLQQRNQLQSQRAQIPSEDAALSAARFSFLELTGRLATQTLDLDKLSGAVDQVLARLDPAYAEAALLNDPEQLLIRRPDILARLYDLEAAEADFAAALAAKLPQLGLSSSLIAQTASGNFSAALEAVLSTTWALFDSGANDALAAQRKANALALARDYAGAYLGAVADLQTAFVTLASIEERLKATSTQLENARDLTNAARNRYLRGATDYLPVISAIQTQQRLELQLLDLEAETLRSKLRIITAQGGGFITIEEPAP